MSEPNELSNLERAVVEAAIRRADAQTNSDYLRAVSELDDAVDALMKARENLS